MNPGTVRRNSWSNRGLNLGVAGALMGGFFLRRVLRSRREISFRDRVVVITGGARGLGLVLARQFAQEGARLALCSRTQSQLLRAREELEARGAEVLVQTCDVSDRIQVDEFLQTVVKRFGRIDVLINVAGIIQVGPAMVMDEEDFQSAMAANFWGTVDMTLSALPRIMASTRHGRVVNITSIGGVVSVPHLLAYTASKFAAVGFSDGLRNEMARHGVRVTTVIPGLMRTGSFFNALFKGDRESEFKWFALGASLPGLTVSAESAASQIIEACRYGDPMLVVGGPARAARIFNALFPRATASILSGVSRLLPRAEGIDGGFRSAEPGSEHQTSLSRSFATRLGRNAALRNNELEPKRKSRQAG